jgi:hypothetical protein
MPVLIESNSKEFIPIKVNKIFKKMRIVTNVLIWIQLNKIGWKEKGITWLKAFGRITGKRWWKDREKTEILRNSIKDFYYQSFLFLQIKYRWACGWLELTIKWIDLWDGSRLFRYRFWTTFYEFRSRWDQDQNKFQLLNSIMLNDGF